MHKGTASQTATRVEVTRDGTVGHEVAVDGGDGGSGSPARTAREAVSAEGDVGDDSEARRPPSSSATKAATLPSPT